MFNYSEKAADLIERASQLLNKPCEYMAVLDVFEDLIERLEAYDTPHKEGAGS